MWIEEIEDRNTRTFWYPTCIVYIYSDPRFWIIKISISSKHVTIWGKWAPLKNPRACNFQLKFKLYNPRWGRGGGSEYTCCITKSSFIKVLYPHKKISFSIHTKNLMVIHFEFIERGAIKKWFLVKIPGSRWDGGTIYLSFSMRFFLMRMETY